MVDAGDLKSSARKGVRVQVPPSAPPDKRRPKKTKLTYLVAGLPVAIWNRFGRAGNDPVSVIRRDFACHYWRADTHGRRRPIRKALWSWPGLFAAFLLYFTRRNGRIVAKRHGRSVPMQLIDQMRVYFSHGILPRWYYIFSLYERGGVKRAGAYLNRFETKGALFRQLNSGASSPLNDKVAFAAHCEAHQVPCVPVLFVAARGEIVPLRDLAELPRTDLFSKPIIARGGTGAERWDWDEEDGLFVRPDGTRLQPDRLLERWRAGSVEVPRLVQPRVRNHPAIADLSNGALTTVRALSCLDERGEPEIVATAFRMAVGSNTTVDNFHAGGIAAAVDPITGQMGQASNLGDDVRLGWLSNHPDTGARIEGRVLPTWAEVRDLVDKAHRAFCDVVVVGWDIALLEDGPRLVEGNRGPDVDLPQRLLRRGLADGRFGELLAHHIQARDASHRP